MSSELNTPPQYVAYPRDPKYRGMTIARRLDMAASGYSFLGAAMTIALMIDYAWLTWSQTHLTFLTGPWRWFAVTCGYVVAMYVLIGWPLRRLATGVGWNLAVANATSAGLGLVSVLFGYLSGFLGLGLVAYMLLWFVIWLAANRFVAALFKQQGVSLGFLYTRTMTRSAVRFIEEHETPEAQLEVLST